MPKFISASVFVWHFLGLASLLVIGAGAVPVFLARTISRSFGRGSSAGSPHPSELTRRDFLGLAAAAGPPLFTLSLTGISMAQLERFRIRNFTLGVAGLPPALDGMTIAHVSDMHVGRFTSGAVLRKMVDATNSLHADLVLLTGDLINDALADLPAALDIVRALDPRSGLWMIEGNHDLIENGAEFERRVRESGVPFLLDEAATLIVRGTPIQLLGLRWTRANSKDHDESVARSVRSLAAKREPGVFPILLAHHPHAFDAAAEEKLPLTLSGHTHGGQLMLNEQVGCGPAIFRYWSGVYARGASQLVVSNGVGNWFPLRVNAPAEIVHITLRSEER